MRIRGVGVIDDAVLDLSPGLNVLTGETGAGKTMVVSGLGLLLGERADSGLVRNGSSSALVEGVVQLPLGHPALVRADEAGADHEDGELVIARTIAAAGRSRAHVGGRTAPVSVLAELGQMLVAVHGQADQWRLKQGDAHREVLDDFGGSEVTVLRERVADLHDSWRDSAREHARLVSEARERAREIDSLTASLEEIEAVDPSPARTRCCGPRTSGSRTPTRFGWLPRRPSPTSAATSTPPTRLPTCATSSGRREGRSPRRPPTTSHWQASTSGSTRWARWSRTSRPT